MRLKNLYCAGTTRAAQFAARCLAENGFPVSDAPRWDTGHLLLDVPSFRPGSALLEKGNLDTLLSSLPGDAVIWGGNLQREELEGFRRVDLLTDEAYLQENAAITARCARKLAEPLIGGLWQDTPTLIIGWGRIGKNLAALLKEANCPVTVTARQEHHRSSLKALGFDTAETGNLREIAGNYGLIFNTVPAFVLDGGSCSGVKMDLASVKGISGEDVIWARGLPGIHAPEESGRLIAKTILRLVKEAEK